MRNASDEQLNELLSAQANGVRLCALQQLKTRGTLTQEVMQKLSKDDDISVRRQAFYFWAQAGHAPSAEEEKTIEGPPKAPLSNLYAYGSTDAGPSVGEIRLAYQATRTYEELMTSIDWYSQTGRDAYETLGLHFWERVADVVRSDLAEGFVRIRQITEDRIYADSPILLVKYQEDFATLQSFIGLQYSTSALKAVIEAGEARDIPLLLGIEQHTMLEEDYKVRGLELIGEYGSDDDVASIIDSAGKLNGLAQAAAIRSALKLSAAPMLLAKTLLERSDHKYSQSVTEWLCGSGQFSTECFFLLLMSDNEADRQQALKYMVRTGQGSDNPATFLPLYIQMETYFYNVVVWLDRLVYAPEPLKSYYFRIV